MGWRDPRRAHMCAGQEAACNLPAAAPTANVVVAEPGCAGCQALSLRVAGGCMFVRKAPMPTAGTLLAVRCLFTPLSNTDASSQARQDALSSS